jgi:hypothetical protein
MKAIQLARVIGDVPRNAEVLIDGKPAESIKISGEQLNISSQKEKPSSKKATVKNPSPSKSEGK